MSPAFGTSAQVFLFFSKTGTSFLIMQINGFFDFSDNNFSRMCVWCNFVPAFLYGMVLMAIYAFLNKKKNEQKSIKLQSDYKKDGELREE
jgi:uncharacterized BrkB/YihY/UPF0761 family membrane protein